ncbi:MAG: hypothetical protein V3S29_09025 [bacterium]
MGWKGDGLLSVVLHLDAATVDLDDGSEVRLAGAKVMLGFHFGK